MYRIPGPLTDAMFATDPKLATRSRNYFNPDINIPSFTSNYKIKNKTKIQFISSAVFGLRNSILFDKPATVNDAINPLTLDYAYRQVDIDRFKSFTNELMVLQRYKLGNQVSSLSAGMQYMNNDLH